MSEYRLFACTACLVRVWLLKGAIMICPECGKGLLLLDEPMKNPGWVRG